MKRLALALAFAALAASSCSSWDTGSDIGDGPRLACIDTVEAFARTAERCGAEYKRTYELLLYGLPSGAGDPDGDCRNVKSIRDESALRGQCIPHVKSLSCAAVSASKTDHPSCVKQLQRTESVRF